MFDRIKQLVHSFLSFLGFASAEDAPPAADAERQPETAVAKGAVLAEVEAAAAVIKVRNKIGFHTGPAGNPSGIGAYMRALDQAKIPFMIKSVDSYGPVFEASQIAKQSGMPHVLVYRISTVGQNHSYDFDVPPYKAPQYVNDPEGAAVLHWQKTKEKLPPEFDKARTWIEPINEVDKNLCDWLGRFAVHIANLAHAEGYKVSLFAWSSGEPERAGWETPGMLAYLRLCAKRPLQAAVALHEYSYTVDDIMHQYPFKIGRFQMLFDVCDKHGIARPTVHITEWGWTLDNVPPPEKAIPDIRQVGQLYARFPQIQGAAIWYLGSGFGGIANRAQRLIQPVQHFTLQHLFEVPGFDQPDPVDPDPEKPDPDRPDDTHKPKPGDGQGGDTKPQPVPLPNGIYIADVTIPDDTRIPAGEGFHKVWRVQNTGNVAWDAGYKLRFVGGNAMGAAAERPLPAAQPGQMVEVALDLTAPSQPGVHVCNWRFVDATGNLFGELIFSRIIVEAQQPVGISNAAYVDDVTIPDDMIVPAGSAITKTWRVRNTGTRAWGLGFTLDFVKGVPMTNQLRHPLPAVAPGHEANISLALVAPNEPGTYFCDWRMRDDKGELFGEVVYMRIVVT